jgi:thiol-disulfide isomerase/thioredoxin
MAQTPSTMLELGTALPPFRLPDADGHLISDRDFQGSPLLVAFICPHCPFVVHVRDGLARFAQEYQTRGLAIVGINANDVSQVPEDGPAGMKKEAAAAGYTFPYLRDESQQLAKVFRAACTPDLYLFDRERRLVYRGQFDSSRPGKDIPVTGEDLRRAADALLEGHPVPQDQKPSVGCSIKWKTS